MSAFGEVRWHWRQVLLRPHVDYKVHADRYVEQEVAVEQPPTLKQNPKTIRRRTNNFVDVPGLSALNLKIT